MRLSELAMSIKDSSNSLDAMVKASIKEKEQFIMSKQSSLMDLEKKLNDKVMGLLMKQKEFGEKEGKMTRMQRDIVMF